MTTGRASRVLMFWGFLFGAACSPDGPDAPPAPVWSANPPVEIGGARPARVILPDDYSVSKRYPIVFLLHGYGVNSLAQDVIFGLKARVNRRQFILVLPEGTKDSGGKRFWNATPECCDFERQGVDDVAYFSGLIDEAQTHYPIDLERVTFAGHSNGGYMSYRLACELPAKIHRVAVLAGSVFLNESACRETKPVSVLHIHGTGDETVPYYSNLGEDLGERLRVHTVGAEAAIKRWKMKAGCAAGWPSPVGADLHPGLTGEETDVLKFTGCLEGIDIEFWRINLGDHALLEVNDRFRDAVVSFLLDESGN